MLAKDPLCAVDSFQVQIRVVLAILLGMRMCPDCPHCAECEDACMDMFGSTAEPMGGLLGRSDGIIGAVEAQKAEGVLHLHFHVFVQCAWQFNTLSDIAQMMKQRLLTAVSLKEYISYCRRATYPDLQAFEEERHTLEQAWPAYAQFKGLCKTPALCRQDAHHPVGAPAPGTDAADWVAEYESQYQGIAKRMLHHVHPLKEDGQTRRVLSSCKRKGKPSECKGGFPLDKELADQPVLVCPGIAAARELPTTG